MENNISSKFINNRKIIIEIRFATNPIIIDKKGEILSKFLESELIKGSSWNLGNAEFRLKDKENDLDARTVIFCDSTRLSIICSDISSNDKLFSMTEKAFKLLKSVIPNIDIIRIGCRIIGTYKTKSQEYKSVVDGFKNLFPNQILLDEFVVKDLRLQLIYQNGQYHIGPINKDDNFLKKQFTYDEAVNEVGFAIDTDNYYSKTDVKEKITESKIKDVYIASLSVEKSLFEKLSEL